MVFFPQPVFSKILALCDDRIEKRTIVMKSILLTEYHIINSFINKNSNYAKTFLIIVHMKSIKDIMNLYGLSIGNSIRIKKNLNRINIIDIEKKYPKNFFKSLNYVLDGQIYNYFSCYSYKAILSIGLLVGSVSSV